MSSKVSNTKLETIFKSMDYDDNATYDITSAIEWVKSRDPFKGKKVDETVQEKSLIKNALNGETLCTLYIPKQEPFFTDTAKAIQDDPNLWREIHYLQRSQIIFELGSAIEQHSELFAQLEVVGRGILPRDTKTKSLPLFCEYLRYYASYCREVDVSKNEQCSILFLLFLSGNESLASIGSILGPTLAAGCKVLLLVDSKLTLCVDLLIEISHKVGIPDGTLSWVPWPTLQNSCHYNTFTMHDDPRVYKPISFSSVGIPIIVLEDADQDSACESIIEAAWSHQGMLPHSARKLFIQENIYGEFLQKLKLRMSKIKVGSPDKKNIDVSINKDVHDATKKIIALAEEQGIEVYPIESDPNVFTPTLLIDCHILNNSVIGEDMYNVPVLRVSAFRTLNEAVALCNNTKQGLAASIFTENISFANQIIRKLQVSTVWINSFGSFAADIAVTPFKHRGNPCFGGEEGFHMIPKYKAKKHELNVLRKEDETIINLNESCKAQKTWCKYSRIERSRFLQNLIQAFKKEENIGISQEELQKWIALVLSGISQNNNGNSHQKGNYNVVTFKEPLGVIAIESPIDGFNILLISALLEGNSIVIVTDKESKEFIFHSIISKLLPKGVCTVFDLCCIWKIMSHNSVNSYFGFDCCWTDSRLADNAKCIDKCKILKECDFQTARSAVTRSKSVWVSAEQSFI